MSYLSVLSRGERRLTFEVQPFYNVRLYNQFIFMLSACTILQSVHQKPFATLTGKFLCFALLLGGENKGQIR